MTDDNKKQLPVAPSNDQINSDSEKSEPSHRPDFKAMPQPSKPSQRYDDRVHLRPGGQVSLRSNTKSQPQQPPKADTTRPSASQRPQISTSYNQHMSKTGRIQVGKSTVLRPTVTDESFDFEGKTYRRESVLSSTTGEAEIFLVSNDNGRFVLKLYYRGYYPSTDVLDVLKANHGGGSVVDVIDYGVWHSRTGEERFGVLMPYYSGGALRGALFRGNAEALENMAIQAINAINYCHEHGILHKDIKPNNFIYSDETRQQIVLADFGIASTFTRDLKGSVIPFVNINQNRTSIYASPEIFNLTVQQSDGRVEVEYSDVKSDFFALGMTLLVLWMGEAPFALLDERSLLKLKRGDRSGLPYPEDIPPHTRNLIKGLTIADPKQRWGYAEFQKWLRGEDEPVKSAAQAGNKSFRILYNGSKNQVATSIKELAQFMLSDPALGEQYLYSGKISKWMAEAGLPEWQMRIDQIINKQYPKSRRSGLMAACYKMDPELPFVGIRGQKCYNNLQIARELTRNAEEYSMVLREWDAPLYVYFASRGIDTGNKFQQLFKTNPWIALWRLAYTLDPECEFPFWSTTRNALVWCSSIDELIEEYASSSQDRYASLNVRTPIGKYTPLLLEDECFIQWLAVRDRNLADTIKQAMDDENSHAADFYTYIFYLLDPSRNFFYEKRQDTFFTPAHLGALINHDMVDYMVIGRHNNNQHFYNEQHRRIQQLSHYVDTKLYYYFKSRGYNNDEFEYIDRCFDLQSIGNRSKPGPYSNKLAALKVCHAFAGETFYYFPVSDVTVTDIDQLDTVPLAEQQEELRRGFLLEWLAVQCQENPQYDGCDDVDYQKQVLKFMKLVEYIDPANHEVVRYNKSHDEVMANASRLQGALRKVKRLKYVLLSFAAMIAVMIAVMLWGGVHSTPNDDSFSYNWQTMAYIAMPLFVLMVVPPIQSFVNDLTKGLLGSPLLFALFVSNVIVIGWEVLRLYIIPYAYFSIPIIYGLFLLWVLYRCFVKRRLYQRRYYTCINPNFQTAIVEPLQFTWRNINDPYREFDSESMSESKEYMSYLKALHRKLLASVRVFAVVLLVLIVGFCFLSIPVSGAIDKVMPKAAEKTDVIQQYDHSDKVMIYVCDVDTSLSVRQTPDHKGSVVGTLSDGDLVEVVGFDGDYAKILYDGNVAYVLKSYLHPLEN